MDQPARLPEDETRTTSRPDGAAILRVMIVDDSAVIRGFITAMLRADPRLEIVASCGNGLTAVQLLTRADPDVVILDIEMPVMDGITALPKLLAEKPGVAVIIASTLSQQGAEISLRAIEMGAADYVPKPMAAQIGSNNDFRRDLIDKIWLHGVRSRHRSARAGDRRMFAPSAPARRSPPVPVMIRTPGTFKPEILAIGSSTGGPQALSAVLKSVPVSIGVPIVITQHMPPAFTSVLAQHVAKASGWPCHEAADGETVTAGTIYVAPGDHHMVFERRGLACVARLTQGPKENFCRPAVDPMLRSLAELFGPRVLALILTGMGSDGLAGGKQVVSAGGTVIAQDEATSVVWGMPGAVANAGLCSAILPLGDIAQHVTRSFTGGIR
jgi:two-component system chemotaxis response regulator CheB